MYEPNVIIIVIVSYLCKLYFSVISIYTETNRIIQGMKLMLVLSDVHPSHGTVASAATRHHYRVFFTNIEIV